MSAQHDPGSPRAMLISGASRGIGACTARYLSSRGWTVYAGVRSVRDVEALCGEGSPKGAIRPVVFDVSSAESIQSAIDFVAADLGPKGGLHGLINNAGIYFGCPLQYLSVVEVQQTVNVNLVGRGLCPQHCLTGVDRDY